MLEILALTVLGALAGVGLFALVNRERRVTRESGHVGRPRDLPFWDDRR